MTVSSKLSNSVSLETLNYFIEDGNLKIINKECTEILKKEKKRYIADFQVSINPKKDSIIIKKGSEQIYLEIMRKLTNTNASMDMFKKFMKNKKSQQKASPSFNPEKISDYIQRTSSSEIFDFPEPLDAEKINILESNYEPRKKISNSFSEDCSFSDASNDFSNNHEISPAPFKKAKSSFGLSICMTPNVNSEQKNTSHTNIYNPPQINRTTSYDDNSSYSSANSNSSTIDSNRPNNTTIDVIQHQNISSNLNSNTYRLFKNIQSTNDNKKQTQQNKYSKNTSCNPSITLPERTKLNIQFNRKINDDNIKKDSSTYTIIGDEAKISKIRSSIVGLLHLKPNTEIQKIIFVS